MHCMGMLLRRQKKVVSEKGRKLFSKEYIQIRFFSMVMGYPYRAFNKSVSDAEKKDNTRIRFELERVCGSIPSKHIKEFVTACRNDDQSNKWVYEIHGILNKNGVGELMHPYMLVLLWLPYQIRCKYFHGEFAVPLLCFENENPLPALKVVNETLDDYLDKNLAHWFKNENQIKTIKTIVDSCSFDNNGIICNTVQQGVQLYFD